MKYALGKLPARPGAVKLKLTDYLTLPKSPKIFGHEKLVTNWEMLGNDTVGDCVLAGAGHETMLWNREASKTVVITDQDAISDYSAITGYNPKNPNSDQGTDMQVAASYRQKTGIKDANNKRHKISAYVALSVGDVTELRAAIYLFSAVGVGIQFPSSAMDQFKEGKSWTVVKGSETEDGHYIPCVGYDTRNIFLVTWGKCIKASDGFIKKYMDEGIVYLSEEFLKLGVSPDGFDLSQLRADLKEL